MTSELQIKLCPSHFVSLRGRRSTAAKLFGGSFREVGHGRPVQQQGGQVGLLTLCQEHLMGSRNPARPTRSWRTRQEEWTDKKINENIMVLF